MCSQDAVRAATPGVQAEDPHYRARGMFEDVPVPPDCNGGRPTLSVPAIPPRLARTPGRTAWAGPAVGAHNAEVWGGLVGLGAAELADLAADQII